MCYFLIQDNEFSIYDGNLDIQKFCYCIWKMLVFAMKITIYFKMEPLFMYYHCFNLILLVVLGKDCNGAHRQRRNFFSVKICHDISRAGRDTWGSSSPNRATLRGKRGSFCSLVYVVFFVCFSWSVTVYYLCLDDDSVSWFLVMHLW